MNSQNLLNIEPYEICSIRPPTENASLTFRLARNCYWNKCSFCPVYKTGARFSRRPLDEVLSDIIKARKIYDLINSRILLNNPFARNNSELYTLINDVKKEHFQAGKIASLNEKANDLEDSPSLDERTRWFLTWFKDRPTIEDSFTHIYSWIVNGGKTCFLGDADSLIFRPDHLTSITGSIKNSFPTVNRITIYGRTRTAAQIRTIDELKAYAASGISRVHFGMESGSDRVLGLVNKGETSAHHITAAQKLHEAGISCSVYVMPGLGGAEYSQEHGEQTAEILTEMNPDFIRLRTLEVFPGTGLDRLMQSGKFTEASEEQVIREIRTIVLNVACETEIVSDSATNLLEINGRLPRDRKVMLEEIDSYLAMDSREKLEFSLQSRLQSFMGQYGGLSQDIYDSINPFISSGTLDMSGMSDSLITSITRLIRGKLMP